MKQVLFFTIPGSILGSVQFAAAQEWRSYKTENGRTLGTIAKQHKFGEGPKLYDGAGNYRGRVSDNQFDPDSVSNQFGTYGSKFSSESINNEFGAGSKFQPDGINNPYSASRGYLLND